MRRTRQEAYEAKVKVAKLMEQANRPLVMMPSIVAAVEFRREQYGLNNTDWAQVLGMAKTHYSEFKAGKRALPLPSMVRAFALGVPAECLFQAEKGAS